MSELVYNPVKSGKRMTIVCFVSGSGTNYREIVAGNPDHDYIVFTNRPGCGGTEIAIENNHKVLELSHIPYLREARKKHGPGRVPRNAPERIRYEKDLCSLIEDEIGKQPDLICLAGFDQWNTDYLVDRYYPRILNVHPGDTTKGYAGLHWIPSAMAILAGDDSIRSTLFFVDKSEDNGPVLVQSAPLKIAETLADLDAKESKGLVEGYQRVLAFAGASRIRTYEEFRDKADQELHEIMANICTELQNVLKVEGDWKIYPAAVRLVAEGRVKVEGGDVFIDGGKMPEYGFRLDE
jgi:phosphoribosylglycinamide formyltransferase-1